MTATCREKLAALREVITYNPLQFGLVICLSLSTAVLEGIGLSFLLPIVEQASAGQFASASEHDLVAAFKTAYGLVGIPFTFETLLAGAAFAIGLRFGTAVLTQYLRVRLVLDYIRTLKTAVFDSILTAELSYIDDRGSDTLLNMLITQTDYPANVLSSVLSASERALLVLVYLALAFTVNPVLTGGAAVVLTIITLGIKSGIGSAYDEGDHVSQANEEMQSHAQSGVQGLRDVRLFGVTETVSTRYADAVDEYMQALVSLRVNQSLVSSLHRFAAALAVLAMVYLALGWSAMSLGAVGVFLFAMMRLAPSVASLQGEIYYIDGELPHLIETLREQEELAARRTASTGTRSVPQPVNSITVENVSFQYTDDESGLTNATLSAQRGEFVAIVGESGAGKSTIVSLLARLYEPDDGRILVNGTALQTIDTDAWRRTIAVVRQDPYLFDETLQKNIVLGTDVDDETLAQACTDAGIDEFVHTLPDGYQTQLGDEGVRLSGGQKQRVAIARALVRDPDVLILDEATSNLDASLEQDVLQAIQQAAQNCIVLIITHRLGSVTAADRIYTVEDGQVVESGQHSELLTADEAYASLYAVDPMRKTDRPATND